VQRLLVRTMLGGGEGLDRPALLLMSATPYRLLRVGPGRSKLNEWLMLAGGEAAMNVRVWVNIAPKLEY